MHKHSIATKHHHKLKLGDQSGFTLIELLVVMAIIGILAVLGIGSFMSSQQKSRDARRKSDLRNIGLSLETYFNDKGEYPLGSLAGEIMGCAGGSICSWGSSFSDENGTVYMVQLPSDPTSGINYFYSSDGSSYQIYARLENTLDQSVPVDADDEPQVYSGLDCGLSCNYGVSSPNTTPAAGRTLANE